MSSILAAADMNNAEFKGRSFALLRMTKGGRRSLRITILLAVWIIASSSPGTRPELGPEWRLIVEAGELVARCAREVGVEVDSIRSRNQVQDLVRAREVVMVLGVESYSLRVKDLARAMKKSPDGMSKSLERAIQRRTEDEEFDKVPGPILS